MIIIKTSGIIITKWLKDVKCMEMIRRNLYLDRIRPFIDQDLIKVLIGLRRSGKTILLSQIRDVLLERGVSKENIIEINFESRRFKELEAADIFYQYVTERVKQAKGRVYLFFDEIQHVEEWHSVIASFRIDFDCDIYVTGSNSKLLSGELATLLSGRYVEINMLPLSFAEFCEIRDGGEHEKLLAEYMKNGALPYVAALNSETEKVEMYLEGIYNTIIVKDIEERQNRKERDPNKRKVTDIALLKNISKFLASSVGSPVSIKSIADYITSSGRKVSQSTIGDYVEALVEPYIFYPAERYDVLGKQLLKMNQKMYIVDLGLRRHLLPRKRYDLGFSLENVVYFELLRRGYQVNVGKVGTTEVDFVARKGEDVFYYQVTASMTEESTFNREMAPLKAITDNYPKTVITLDRFSTGNYEGIHVVNAIDWLLEK